MPAPRYRSRTLRRVKATTPSGKNVVHYKRRKNDAPRCADCGQALPGVARGTPAQVQKLAKSSRRPERPYGGKLCSACMRRTIVAKVRS